MKKETQNRSFESWNQNINNFNYNKSLGTSNGKTNNLQDSTNIEEDKSILPTNNATKNLDNTNNPHSVNNPNKTTKSDAVNATSNIGIIAHTHSTADTNIPANTDSIVSTHKTSNASNPAEKTANLGCTASVDRTTNTEKETNTYRSATADCNTNTDSTANRLELGQSVFRKDDKKDMAFLIICFVVQCILFAVALTLFFIKLNADENVKMLIAYFASIFIVLSYFALLVVQLLLTLRCQKNAGKVLFCVAIPIFFATAGVLIP